MLRRMERFKQDGESVDLETVASELGIAQASRSSIQA